MDAYATSAIIGFIAALIALVSFYYRGYVKFYAYGVPFVTVCTAFLITADACNQQPTCKAFDASRVERMREFIRCRLAYSGICQDFALYLLYVAPLTNGRISGLYWCLAYMSLAGLEVAVYLADRCGVDAQYATAGVGTVFNIMFFWWIVRRRLWPKFKTLYEGAHDHEDEPASKSHAAKCAVVCVVMFAYIFAVGVVLRDAGPNLSALVSCISPLSFITVPLCMAIWPGALDYFQRKMQGVLIAISINNVFFYWALYGFTYVDASLADYRAPYLWPFVLLVAFGMLTVLFLWCLKQRYIINAPRDVIELTAAPPGAKKMLLIKL